MRDRLCRASSHSRHPRAVVTDKLKSYSVVHRGLTPGAIDDTSKYANNRSERSHPMGVRERGMRRFKSPGQAQRFMTIHAPVHNLFNLACHANSALNYRLLRARAFATSKFATA
ncbi:MAG: DDE-type integrase/transposase/recombinase [Burkholderiaceae bacterium]